MGAIREIIYSNEFYDYYNTLEENIREKYDYALTIVRSQYIVNKKFIKNIENSDFYELRISIGNNEYRTVIFAIDHNNFIQANRIILLNSFLKKDKKQYKKEINKAVNILKKYMEE